VPGKIPRIVDRHERVVVGVTVAPQHSRCPEMNEPGLSDGRVVVGIGRVGWVVGDADILRHDEADVEAVGGESFTSNFTV
jgi:hypothetical protein